jgi:hypothetical protein
MLPRKKVRRSLATERVVETQTTRHRVYLPLWPSLDTLGGFGAPLLETLLDGAHQSHPGKMQSIAAVIKQ